ncbi:uncharacterized protein LOC118187982 [Stegodyphus dumicola]|uniref:uncharacterized protein LOC118187982 n=1 Tax=Stegodyphus dumicola TaxID=202533 RepID=UPI0015AF17EE|nr:uncharacterized protein LOC118187982 [Stegodyphus dumicola]
MSVLSNSDVDLRLLVMSNGFPNIQFLAKVARKTVRKAIYTYESSSLDDILSFIIAELGGKKVESIAFVLHGDAKEMYLAGVGNVVLSYQALKDDKMLREFFICLSSTFMNIKSSSARLDFLNSQLKDEIAVLKLSDELHKITNCPVEICKDLNGSEEKAAAFINSDKKILMTWRKQQCIGNVFLGYNLERLYCVLVKEMKFKD